MNNSSENTARRSRNNRKSGSQRKTSSHRPKQDNHKRLTRRVEFAYYGMWVVMVMIAALYVANMYLTLNGHSVQAGIANFVGSFGGIQIIQHFHQIYKETSEQLTKLEKTTQRKPRHSQK